MIAMFAIMAATAFADGTTYTLTIKDSSSNEAKSDYSVYQLFTATYSADGSTATNPNIADAYKEVLAAAIKEVDSNSTVTASSDATAILDAINSISSDDKTKFAAAVYSAIASNSITATSTVKDSATISNLASGYYLIVDAKNKNGLDASNSTYILWNVYKDDTVKVKSSLPAVEKKVKENEAYANSANADGGKTDSRLSGFKVPAGYNDIADYDTNDDISFMLIGSLPTNYESYTTYSYIFTDTLAKGFTLDETSVEVNIYDKDSKVKGSAITTDFTASTTPNSDGTTTLTIKANGTNGLKNITNLTSTDYIVVTYTAKLNKDANVGTTGNVNEVYLQYSNNPNYTGKGETTTDKDGNNVDGDGNTDTIGQTTVDEVIVFTYDLEIEKVDASNDSPIDGAEFVLYKTVTESGKETTKYAVISNDGIIESWKDNENDATPIKPTKTVPATVKGLDEGTYYLKETKSPTGYNSLSSDVKVDIEAVTKNSDEWTDGNATSAITSLTYKIDDVAGSRVVTIKNTKGSALPTTGGIGTTILYVIGGILVICAGVALITKKRMKDAE
jgi:LPXTG-motif cell wall-anchored protein